MNISISGYGKMGKEIEKVALTKGHTIAAIIDSVNDWNKFEPEIRKSNVVIDFSQPDVVIKNIHKCFAMKIPVVIGTTGWEVEKQVIKEYCLSNKLSLFTASNFSIGVNILYEINKALAQLLNNHPDYNIELEEIHHIHKKDQPSGTAIELANQIINLVERKKQWTLDESNNNDNLIINSIRDGEIPGTHIIKYTSDIDELEIKHTAKSREGFARGAVSAAEWLIGRSGYFEMKDLLGLNENSN